MRARLRSAADLETGGARDPRPALSGPGGRDAIGDTAAATLEGVADAARSTRTVRPFISIVDRVVAFLPATQAVGAAQR